MESNPTQRYEVGSSLGSGGAGEVFRARDTRLERPVAFKRFWPSAPGVPAGDAYAQALREARHLATLSHPHIVSVYDLGEDEQGPFLVMELVEGDTLEGAVERGPFSLEDFLRLARQSLDALIAAHRVGLLHRDLKPGNLMLKHGGAAGENFEVKLLDFGLSDPAAKRGPEAGDGRNIVYGSVHFMAPEQFTREHPPDARTDLYSLGCLFYYALTAAYPVKGDTVSAVVERHLKADIPPLPPRRPEVPEPLCAWVMRLVSLRPADRPESAARALEELQTLLGTVRHPATRAVGTSPSPGWLAAAVLGAGVLLGVVVTSAVWEGLRPRRPNPPAAVTPSAQREAVPVLAATDTTALRAHLGAEVIAEGRLRALENNAGRKVFSLRFEPGADGTTLALVFPADATPSGLAGDDLRAYVNHRVRARGRVLEHDGALQMVIRDATQIEAAY